MANSLDSLPLQAVPITSYASTEWPRPTHCISYKDILTQVQLVDFVTPLLCVSLVWFFWATICGVLAYGIYFDVCRFNISFF